MANVKNETLVLPPLSELVEVAPSHVGQGVFALRRFEADEVVGLIEGDVIDDPDYGSNYSMDLGGTLTLEPHAPFRFLNHHCQPNCTLVIEEYEDGSCPQMWLETLSAVNPGEELLIDYGWPALHAIVCQCGSPQCRGWIVDVAELGDVGRCDEEEEEEEEEEEADYEDEAE